MEKAVKPLKITKKHTDLEKKLRDRFNQGFTEIQVISGPRQVGKTTAILNLLKDYAGDYHYVSAEEKIVLNVDWIEQVWQEAILKSATCLLVIDEIQKIQNWSEKVKFLWDKQKIGSKQKLKLVLLGSSSVKIQQGLAESLTGRFELIRAYHWTYQESQLIKKMTLQEYLKYGGYPGAYKYIKNQQRFIDYMQNSIVNTVIEKDLLTQGKVRNPALFKQTFQVLQSLPATEISYTKLLGQLQEKGNTDLIKGYLDLYEGAYLFTQVHKYTANKLKIRLSTPKIICMAPALLDLIEKKSNPIFLGRCFESMVGSDLIRAGLEVYYWREGDFEVDFVIKFQGVIVGVEVKSQKRKSSKSVTEFKKVFPEAKVVFINFENYEKFSLNVEKFLDQIL